jgi:hypothetical protein
LALAEKRDESNPIKKQRGRLQACLDHSLLTGFYQEIVCDHFSGLISFMLALVSSRLSPSDVKDDCHPF